MQSPVALPNRKPFEPQLRRPHEQETHVIGVPCDRAHTSPATDCHGASNRTPERTCTTTICEGNDFAFPAKIPHQGVSGTACASEHILDLLVPRHACHFVDLVTTGPRGGRVRFRAVVQIPNVDLMHHYVKVEARTREKLTSPLTAPDDKRFVWMGLKSRPRTGPV